MNDVARLILEAWEKLGPGIKGDPEELARRLARRRLPIMTRPVRAWCLALRASDRRITPMDWILTPMHAMDLNHPEHPYEPIEHTVTIQPHGLRKFCRPVRTDSWGERVHDVARMLGVTPQTLNHARHAGVFTQHIVLGKRARKTPLIHSWKTLDPSGHQFSRPEQLWGALWEFLPDMIPDDFEQTITRVPKFNFMNDKNHPARECGEGQQFLGWRWICPACKNKVRKIFYPLPPQTLFNLLGRDPALSDVDALHVPPPTFACSTCHNVSNPSRLAGLAWNHVVAHLTGGLLYGREVQKPTWYRFERKRTKTRILHGRPATKREAVFDRLKKGCAINEIALDLMTTKSNVINAICLICKQERVKNRHELAKKLGWPPPPKNGLENHLARATEREKRVLPLLLQELSYAQIAKRTGMTRQNVQCAAIRIYKKYGVPPGQGLRGLAAKLNHQLTPRFTAHDQIRSLLLAGERVCDIARTLGMQYQMVANRCAKIYKKHGVTRRKDLLAKLQITPALFAPVCDPEQRQPA